MGVIIAGTNIAVDAALEEVVEHTNDITEYPIESGAKIHSHAHLLPRIITVDGIIVGSNWRAKVARLINARESRAIVSYSGRVFWPSLVIKELQDTYDSGIANGARIRVVFQQVKIVGGAAGAAAGVALAGYGTVAQDPAEVI